MPWPVNSVDGVRRPHEQPRCWGFGGQAFAWNQTSCERCGADVRAPRSLGEAAVVAAGADLRGSRLGHARKRTGRSHPAIERQSVDSGDAVVGGVLTADPGDGTWTGDVPMTYTYQWSDGATDSTDTLTPADVGQYVTVTVTATNDAGSASVTTAAYGPVLPLPPASDPNGAPPMITGTPQRGDTLSVSHGSWDNGPTGFSYQVGGLR
jgi:hypothetical protein